MIHIGDRLGKKYDYWRYYILFRLKYGIRFINYTHHWEILKYPKMYIRPGFVPKPEQIIFDIGAQYGDYAMIWEKRDHANVWAFEILPENYMEMQKDLFLNKSSVHIVRIAVGNGNPIEYVSDGNMASYAHSDNPKISTMRIDDFVQKNKIYPHIMKIDVEGFEYEVLEGSIMTINTYHPKIIIETHSSELRKKCDNFLREQEYKLEYEGRKTKGEKWMDEITNLFYEYEGVKT